MTPLLPVLPLAQAAASQGIGSLAPLVFQFGAIFAIFYFLMIRPQQKQRKQHEAAIMALKKGDEIVTSGGLVGEVVHIKEGLKNGQPASTVDDRVTIKSGESRVVVERGRIAKVFAPVVKE
jgi:preprotein translocase subunit YajC